MSDAHWTSIWELIKNDLFDAAIHIYTLRSTLTREEDLLYEYNLNVLKSLTLLRQRWHIKIY